MQQDDQNTFKFHSMINQTQQHQSFGDKINNNKHNIIRKINIIRDGINFIVPLFWYQELICINQNNRNIEDIKFPPFQFMVNFLRLHALQNPSQSPFQINQRYSALSTSFLADLLQQSNFNESKTLKFSKLNDTRECSEIQWSLINPHLWNLIENRIQLMALDKQSINQQIRQNQMSLSEEVSFEQLPRLSVMLRKQFILQKGQSRTNQKFNTKDFSTIEICYKNKKHYVKNQDLHKQITNQLKILSPQQTNFLLIIDETHTNSLELKKLYISGFFPENMGFKQLIKSLIKIDSKNKDQIVDKFYIYDQNGHKVNNKINTIASLHQLASQKQIIVSTLSIQSIIERNIGLKNCLKSLLSSISNNQNDQNEMDYQDISHQKNKQRNENLNGIYQFLNKKAKQLQYEQLKHTFINLGNQTQQNPQKNQQIRSGFKPFNKPSGQGSLQQSNNHIQIQTSSLNLETQNTLHQGQNQDDFRLIQSLTTNMDTPIQQQSQSQRPSSSNYQNKRLNRHSTYSRQQRKKKSQSYLQKKKKNNVILKDNSLNIKDKKNSSTQHKKRVKHSLFQSLASLDKEDQALNYLLENMRVIARQTVYVQENELIKHPYTKQKINNDSQDLNIEGQGKQEKVQNNWQQKQGKQKQSQHCKKQKQFMLISLQQIATMIQQKYQPLLTQKQSLDQLQKIQLYEQYENQLNMKKDNEQIKTIVDNSQGPYSQIEKHQVRQKYNRLSEKKRTRNQMEIDPAYDEVNSLTDGNPNYLQYNEETL